jgi:hypothetical protein
MGGRVKGVLFADYVRMLRAHRDLTWHEYLQPEDRSFVDQDLDPAGWYPMDAFERVGIAMLETIAEGDLGLVREWGRASAAQLAGTVEHVIVPGDPRESLMRFFVLRSSLYDFEALSVLHVSDTSATVRVAYGMDRLAEQAAAVQTMGFLEGLVDLADGDQVRAEFLESSWRGDPRTVISLTWAPPRHAEDAQRSREPRGERVRPAGKGAILPSPRSRRTS